MTSLSGRRGLASAAARDGRWGRRRGAGAFTLIEIVASLTIIAALTAIAVPYFQQLIDTARVARAIGDIQALEIDLASADTLPSSLAGIGRGAMRDPWGHAYVYYKFPRPKNGSNAPPSGARRDRFLVPVNSTYDLYSKGADGATAIAFTAKLSQDDVVRANDGGYVGLAGKF